MTQFACLQNIHTFLKVCRDVFELEDEHLFQPSELFDLSDLEKVLITLSKLSQLSQVSDEMTSHGGSSAVVAQEESIYDHICYIPFRRKQAPGVTREKRDYVKDELVETERNYLNALVMMKQDFMMPLKSVLQDEDWNIIFFGVEEMVKIHKDFLRDLSRCSTLSPVSAKYICGSQKSLGDVFLNWKKRFIIYGDYCANLTRAQNLLEQLCAKHEVISEEVDKCERNVNEGRFRLRDLLSLPMARILKYHLLLQKLLNSTSEKQHGFEEVKSTEKALREMLDVSEFTNEVKRDGETLEIIRKVEGSIHDFSMPKGMTLKDYGRLHKDGELRIREENDSSCKPRYVFIFDKTMLLCGFPRRRDKLFSGFSKQYNFKESLSLENYRIDDVPSLAFRKGYSWNLVHHQEKNVLRMFARTEEQKRRWMKAIQDALNNIQPEACVGSEHHWQMHTFSKGTCCSFCNKFLKGSFYQGYQCGWCGAGVHRDCISLYSRSCNIHPPELLGGYPWYAGEMDRVAANSVLEGKANGTFLLRIHGRTASANDDSTFALLSLRWNDHVRHMKIRVSKTERLFNLSESRYFKSVVELINWYRHNSLGECFSGLNACLESPAFSTE